MTFQLSVVADIKPGRRSLRNFEKKRHPAIVQRTLNRTIRGVVTDSARILRSRIKMPSKEIRGQFRIVYARNNSGWAKATVKKKRPPNLARFGAKAQKKRIKGKIRLSGKGLRIRAWEKRELYTGSFLWERGGSKTVMVRIKGAAKETPKKRTGGDGKIRRYKRGPNKGKPVKRQPVKALYGPSLFDVMKQNPSKKGESYYREVVPKARERFRNEYNRQMRRLSNGR